jgi:hypothetical protein
VAYERRNPHTVYRHAGVICCRKKLTWWIKYWTQNICEPELRESKRGTEDGEGKGEQDAFCAIASPPSSYLGWLATNMCICNGQRSSDIFCEAYFAFLSETVWPCNGSLLFYKMGYRRWILPFISHCCVSCLLFKKLKIKIHGKVKVKVKVKLSRYTPWRRLGGKEV